MLEESLCTLIATQIIRIIMINLHTYIYFFFDFFFFFSFPVYIIIILLNCSYVYPDWTGEEKNCSLLVRLCWPNRLTLVHVASVANSARSVTKQRNCTSSDHPSCPPVPGGDSFHWIFITQQHVLFIIVLWWMEHWVVLYQSICVCQVQTPRIFSSSSSSGGVVSLQPVGSSQ